MDSRLCYVLSSLCTHGISTAQFFVQIYDFNRQLSQKEHFHHADDEVGSLVINPKTHSALGLVIEILSCTV